MRNLLDGIENAAAKLQDLGEKAVDGAKDVFSKAGDGIERAVEEAKDALAHAIDSLSPADEEPVPPTDEVPEAPQKPLTPYEEIDLDVEAQVAQIRSAEHTPGSFSDYIAKKFGKNSNQ